MSLELKKEILARNLHGARLDNQAPSKNDINEIINDEFVNFIYDSMEDYHITMITRADGYFNVNTVKKDFLSELDKLIEYFKGRGLQREIIIINELKKKYNG